MKNTQLKFVLIKQITVNPFVPKALFTGKKWVKLCSGRSQGCYLNYIKADMNFIKLIQKTRITCVHFSQSFICCSIY